jgi:Glyoxalase-like domain
MKIRQSVRVEDHGGSGAPTSFREVAVDHVLLATRDLGAARQALSDRFSLQGVEGGRHPDWGTANWIVPVGDAYLELVAVVDERVAERSAFGRWVARANAPVVEPIGWAVRTSSLDAVATRLGLTVHDGSRATPTGERLTWRLAGIERAATEPIIPFFIEWGEGMRHPSRVLGAKSNDSVAIIRLGLTGDAERLYAWLQDEGGPIAVDAGRPGLREVVLSTPAGEMRIDETFR